MRSVPERTCVGCGSKKPQTELLRIAARNGLSPHIDQAGKAPGRGAYLCKNAECLKVALQRRALRRSLKLQDNLTTAQEDELRSQIKEEP